MKTLSPPFAPNPPDRPGNTAYAVESAMWEQSVDMLAAASPAGYLTRVNPA
ncbi:MAG: hypothetical protein ACR2KV_08865 [Solirubrobacteraceae bacterium]